MMMIAYSMCFDAGHTHTHTQIQVLGLYVLDGHQRDSIINTTTSCHVPRDNPLPLPAATGGWLLIQTVV